MAVSVNETEITYDAPAGATLPRLDGQTEVAGTSGPGEEKLEAEYYDTDEPAHPVLAAPPLRERPEAGCGEKRPASAARPAAAWDVATGRPWPHASTSGSSLASAETDCLAVGQFQVEM